MSTCCRLRKRFLCIVIIEGIIPELPIRLGTVKPKFNDTNFAHRSYKVDFYLLGSNGTNYLVEFKADSGSRRGEQDCYLDEAKTVGMKALVEGICQIASVSSYKKKYNHLIKKLEKLGLIDNKRKFSGKSDGIDVIYLQPHITDGDKCIDFEWISNWMRQKYRNNEFELVFANTLKEWSG